MSNTSQELNATGDVGPITFDFIENNMSAASEETTAVADDDGPTTFESLPAELRNRIYDLSGCLRFYEDPGSGHSVCGAYTTKDHANVHGCEGGSNCEFADWDGYIDWPSACLLVNGGSGHPLKPPSNSRWKRCGDFPHLTMIEAQLYPYLDTKPAICHQATGAQPVLTKVSKKVRDDTVPIFYGNQAFIFRMISANHTDVKSILAWLDKLGPSNASYLREVYVVYARKSQRRFINKHLLSNMNKRGVKTNTDEPGVVRLLRLGYPFKSDDEAVMKLVRKTRSDEAKRTAGAGKKNTE